MFRGIVLSQGLTPGMTPGMTDPRYDPPGMTPGMWTSMWNYNEKIYKEKKINNVFVAESCNEVLQEKILNYPNKLISYINAQHPKELRLIIDAYKGLKINYINDVKGMILVKERFKELYDKCDLDTKKLLKDVVD